MNEISYQDLYKRWEEGNWSATSLDFSADKRGWEKLSPEKQEAHLWLYAMFFVGEDAVADGLSPYVDAAPTEEQKYFLTTQQVDEARHAVFFDRFFENVLGAGGDIAARLAEASANLSWGHQMLFQKLDEVCADLRRDQSLPSFARAVTLYHMVIEGTVAQPGQHFIEDHLLPSAAMPAFAEGLHNVARDEQRHIAFGVKCLSDLFALSDECKEASMEMLEETMPYVAGILQEPEGKDYFSQLGFSQEDIFVWSVRSMERKWKQTGCPPGEMPPRSFPLLSEGGEEVAAREQTLLLGRGVLGSPGRVGDADEDTVRALFNLLARTSNRGRVGSLFAVTWKFRDAPGASVLFSPDGAKAEEGESSGAHLVLDTSWQTWVEIFRGDKNMLQEIARGEVRVEKGFTKLPLLARALS